MAMVKLVTIVAYSWIYRLRVIGLVRKDGVQSYRLSQVCHMKSHNYLPNDRHTTANRLLLTLLTPLEWKSKLNLVLKPLYTKMY